MGVRVLRLDNYLRMLDCSIVGALLLFLTSACHSTEIASPVTLDQIKLKNTLQSCLTLEPLAIQSTPAGVILQTRVTHQKTLAECLCMTTLMNYHVFEERTIEGRSLRTEWVKGFRNTAMQQDGSWDIVLLTEPTFQPKGQLVLELRCRPHE